MLQVNDLSVTVDGKSVLKGFTLSVPAGEVHALMGPNGVGKSTLGYVLAGREGYTVTNGAASLQGKDLLSLAPEERAAAGLFLAFQYPVEIPGVTALSFLKTAVNAQRKARGEDELDALSFMKLVRQKAAQLGIGEDMLKRAVNVGFSGGEKKRFEVLQMVLLEPAFCVLDETDSGLDVDAMKIVANGINALRAAKRSMLIITHYQRLLELIKPDRVHILGDGQVKVSGGPELVAQLEEKGFAAFGINQAA